MAGGRSWPLVAADGQVAAVRPRGALTAARGDARAARGSLRRHGKVCASCHRALLADRPVMACDVGFTLWQDVTATMLAAERAQQDAAGRARPDEQLF